MAGNRTVTRPSVFARTVSTRTHAPRYSTSISKLRTPIQFTPWITAGQVARISVSIVSTCGSRTSSDTGNAWRLALCQPWPLPQPAGGPVPVQDAAWAEASAGARRAGRCARAAQREVPRAGRQPAGHAMCRARSPGPAGRAAKGGPAAGRWRGVSGSGVAWVFGQALAQALGRQYHDPLPPSIRLCIVRLRRACARNPYSAAPVD